MLPWPTRVETSLGDFLPTVGQVVRRFGDRLDSRTTIVGMETDAGPVIVKHAADEESVEWLRSAIRFHTAVAHPSIVPIVYHLATPNGLAVVQPWAPGDVLQDAFDPTVPTATSPVRLTNASSLWPCPRSPGPLVT